MSRASAVLSSLLLALVSLGVTLFAFEVGLRVAGHRAIYELYSKPSIFWEHDERLGWRHEPEASGVYVGPRPWPIEFESQVEINSLGMRGPEIPPREPREKRILFIGDSMVAGFEVAYADTFVARVGEALTRRLGHPVRTINAGVRGYGTDQYHIFYSERLRVLGAEVVALWHTGNDPADNLTIHELRRPFGKPALRPLDDGGFEVIGSPVPQYPKCSEYQLSEDFEIRRVDGAFTRALCASQAALFDHSALFSYLTLSLPWNADLLRRLYHFANPHGRHAEKVRQDRTRNRGAQLAVGILQEMHRSAIRDGSEFLLIGTVDHLARIDVPRLKSTGITVVSLDALEQDPVSLRWKHDSHFNPEGHRVVAESLVGPLEHALKARR